MEENNNNNKNNNSNQNTIFRQKSLDRVSSPEQLDTYLKITSVSVWMVLVAIILILVGAIVWATVGKIESSVPTACVISDGSINCFLPESVAKDKNNEDRIKEGMNIVINEEKYSITSVSLYGLYQSGSDDIAMNISGASEGEYVYIVSASTDAKEGNYKAKIVLKEVSPLVYVFN